MFVAAREMKRLAGRFALLTGAVALLVVLLLFFQTVAGALQSGLTGGVVNNQADVFVYGDKARLNPSASFLFPTVVDQIATVDGVSAAAGVIKAQFTAQGSSADVAVIGLEDPTVGGPAEITDGRAPNVAGEALAANPTLSSSDLTFAIGDSVTIEGVDLTIVGLADGAEFDVSPTVYVLASDVQQMQATKAGGDVPQLLSWVAVVVDEGAEASAVADKITDTVTVSAPPVGQPPGDATAPQPGDTQSSTPATTTPGTSSPDSSSPDSGTQPPGSTPATSTPASTPASSEVATTAPVTTTPATTAPTTTGATATTVDDVGAQPPSDAAPPGGPPADVPALSGGVEAVDRATAAANLPGVDQISQSFNILYLLLFIVVTIVTGVFFLILTVQKQSSLVLMRALGASKSDAVRPVLIEVVVVVGLGSVVGVGVAALLLYVARDVFGSSLDPTTTVISVAAILVLGVLASIGSVRRVLAIDPVQAARKAGE